VSRDYNANLNSFNTPSNTALYRTDYELPDGTLLSLGAERFQCPETMFSPNVLEPYSITNTHTSHQDLFAKCIESLPPDLQPTLTSHILIGGGNTCFGGYKNRAKSELSKILAQKKLKEPNSFICSNGRCIEYVTARKFCQWLPCDKWILKDTYDEIGPSVVHSMCVH